MNRFRLFWKALIQALHEMQSDEGYYEGLYHKSLDSIQNAEKLEAALKTCQWERDLARKEMSETRMRLMEILVTAGIWKDYEEWPDRLNTLEIFCMHTPVKTKRTKK